MFLASNLKLLALFEESEKQFGSLVNFILDVYQTYYILYIIIIYVCFIHIFYKVFFRCFLIAENCQRLVKWIHLSMDHFILRVGTFKQRPSFNA